MQHTSKPAPDVPKWSALLVEAVNKPGLIMEAYSAFHNYSIGNQILALVQCQLRGLEPGPINTFPGWQALGRTVKRGERALILCMPISRKVRDEEAPESNGENGERRFTIFMHKARWFAISQTVGDEFTAPRLPEWEADRPLAALDIAQIPFIDTDGNCQGYAKKRQIAINPVAQLPYKTLFHEAAPAPVAIFYRLVNQHSTIKKADQHSLYFSPTTTLSLFETPTTAHQINR